MGPFVYGHSITIGSDGKPVIREFGNVKPSSKSTAFGTPRPSLEVKEEREPLVDVLGDKENVRVIVEVPGVDKKDIKLSCSERMLTISVNAEEKKYYKDVELPDEVDPKTAKAKYTNGVLEITLAKVKTKKLSGETIRIE